MEELDQVGRIVLQNESTLLWVAAVLGALFLGFLAFDFVTRFRDESRFHDRPWRRAIKRPFRRLAELRAGLKELRRQRAERKKWDGPEKRRRRRPRRVRQRSAAESVSQSASSIESRRPLPPTEDLP